MISRNYFQNCDDDLDRSASIYYYQFLQYWILHSVKDWQAYNKFVFWFSYDELQKVEFVKLGSIIKSYERNAWLYPTNDLDSRYEEELEFTDEFVANEERFCEKMIYHWSFTPLSENEFLISVAREALTQK